MIVSPNTGFVLLIAGVLSIYRELLAPGRIFPGLAGSAMTAIGAYSLWTNSPSMFGVLLVCLAVVSFIIEVIWDTVVLAGIAGTGLLSAGFCKLFDSSPRIAPELAIPVCIIFGAVTIFLARAARQGRRNKWSDITVGNH